jgi:hypothetical protein
LRLTRNSRPLPQDEFRIFLSAVTSEFGRARDALAADLRSREALVRVQSDFRQEAGRDTTLKKLHDYRRDAPAGYHDGLTVAKTFALAIEEAAKLNAAAEPLIVHAALLAPEPIPLFLFTEGREQFDEPLATALAGDGLDEAVAALRTFALVDREIITEMQDASRRRGAVRLHRLVREVAAARREREVRDCIRRALVAALMKVYLPMTAMEIQPCGRAANR